MTIPYLKLIESEAPPKTAFTKRYDYDAVTGVLLYEGFAPGIGNVLAGDALWSIKKYTYSVVNGSQAVTLVQWADGNSMFDNVWNNRAALSYQ